MGKYNVQSIIEGTNRDFLFFWGHNPSEDGEITSSCLSQWFIAPMKVDGIVYPTAEHWMMSKKALLFGDTVAHQRIMASHSPKIAKHYGRMVAGYDESTWVAQRESVLLEGNQHKFTQHSGLKKYLLGTGDQIIVEASPYDKIYSIGMDSEDPNALIPEHWNGLNVLGFCLMEVRDILK